MHGTSSRQRKKYSLRVGVCSEQGLRPTQEDAHYHSVDIKAEYPDITRNIRCCEQAAFFGVYDGHGGDYVANFTKLNLHLEVLQILNATNDPLRALLEGFSVHDSKTKHVHENGAQDHSGSTVVAVLALDDKLFVANLGDTGVVGPSAIHSLPEIARDQLYLSEPIVERNDTIPNFLQDVWNYDKELEARFRDVLCAVVDVVSQKLAWSKVAEILESCDPEFGVYLKHKYSQLAPPKLQGAPKLLSVQHRPTNAAEMTRINAVGGTVLFGRVLGSLAVSRAFGDPDYKQKTFEGALVDYVSAVPAITAFQLTPDVSVLVLACDGLLDQEPLDVIHDSAARWKAEGKTPAEVAQMLAALALSDGSTDNVTVMVVYFDWM